MEKMYCLIITFTVSAVIGMATYLIQYYSVISPCNIEFDGRRKFEINIMNKYNALFDKIFFVSVMLMMAGVTVSLVFENVTFMFVLCIVELVYFIINILAMTVMYIRSRLYWYLYDERELKRNSFVGNSVPKKILN